MQAQGLAMMAAWEERHIFAQLGDDIPLLPLGDLYVEPLATELQGGPRSGAPESPPAVPILDVMRAHIDARDPALLVVLGDFGLGKSLSARTFACELARRALASDQPTLANWLPVYIPCGQILTDVSFDLPRVFARAAQLMHEERGEHLGLDDEALTVPPKEQRLAIILDGLDERALSQAELDALFRRLRELTAARRRFIVLSRPGILEPVLLRQSKEHGRSNFVPTRIVSLERFETDRADPEVPCRVERWLNRWNRLAGRQVPITCDDIDQRGLLEIAGTPVLLFVIAFGWDQSLHTGTSSKPALYEGFMRRIVHSKLPQSGETHGPIQEAARALSDHLIRHQLVGRDATPEDALPLGAL
jgi:hypothetical protein